MSMACTQLAGSLHVHLSYHTMKSQVSRLLAFEMTTVTNKNNDAKAKCVSPFFICKKGRVGIAKKRVLLITYAAHVVSCLCFCLSIQSQLLLGILEAVSGLALFSDRKHKASKHPDLPLRFLLRPM